MLDNCRKAHYRICIWDILIHSFHTVVGLS